MDFQNLSNEEIQKVIFEEIEKGTYVLTIKQALIAQGKIPEAYYFTTAAQHEEVMQPTASYTTPANEGMSGMQVVSLIISILAIILKIATCNN
jgi:hypothetical protein